MKKYIVEYRRKCDKCAARKPSKQRNRAPLGQYLAGLQTISPDQIAIKRDAESGYIFIYNNPCY
jgi:hypothetical protein